MIAIIKFDCRGPKCEIGSAGDDIAKGELCLKVLDNLDTFEELPAL